MQRIDFVARHLEVIRARNEGLGTKNCCELRINTIS
jgi:hypothetical protein